MAKHFCLKQWVNGNEISVSIDDNLNDTFRGEVAVFSSDDITEMVEIGNSRGLSGLARDILEAIQHAENHKGKLPEFETKIVVD